MSAHDFLVELGTEELPPKTLKNLGQAFLGGVEKGLKAAGLLDLSIPVGFEVPDPTRASDEDETPLLPGEEDTPEFAQDFVSED